MTWGPMMLCSVHETFKGYEVGNRHVRVRMQLESIEDLRKVVCDHVTQ
jgi:hypothetical protein